MENKYLKFVTPDKEVTGKKLTMVPVLLFCFFLVYMFLGAFGQTFHDLSTSFKEELSLTLFIFFGSIPIAIGIYNWLRQIFEMFTNSFIVELCSDRIVGSPLWGKSKEISYDDVVSLEKQRFMFHSMKLKDDHGKTLLTVHSGLNGYGRCVEEIRRRCKNLKFVDYRGVEKKPAIWEDEHKLGS